MRKLNTRGLEHAGAFVASEAQYSKHGSRIKITPLPQLWNIVPAPYSLMFWMQRLVKIEECYSNLSGSMRVWYGLCVLWLAIVA